LRGLGGGGVSADDEAVALERSVRREEGIVSPSFREPLSLLRSGPIRTFAHTGAEAYRRREPRRSRARSVMLSAGNPGVSYRLVFLRIEPKCQESADLLFSERYSTLKTAFPDAVRSGSPGAGASRSGAPQKASRSFFSR